MTDNEKLMMAAVGTAFVTGYLYSSYSTRKAIAKHLTARKEMMTNGLVSAVSRAREENMSDEDFQQELSIEMEFLHIANRA